MAMLGKTWKSDHSKPSWTETDGCCTCQVADTAYLGCVATGVMGEEAKAALGAAGRLLPPRLGARARGWARPWAGPQRQWGAGGPAWAQPLAGQPGGTGSPGVGGPAWPVGCGVWAAVQGIIG